MWEGTYWIPELPRLQADVMQWRARAAYRRSWRKKVSELVQLEKLKPDKPLTQAAIVCTRYSTRKCDYGGLVYSFKPLLDSLVENLVLLDDSMEVLALEEYHLLPPDRRGKGVEIIVRQLA